MHIEDLLFKEDWSIIESLLPDGWQEKCKELKAYQLNRAFDGPGGLLRTLLIHCAQGYSFRVTAALAEEGGVATLSDVALNKRLRLGSDWLRWLSNGVAQTQLLHHSHDSFAISICYKNGSHLWHQVFRLSRDAIGAVLGTHGIPGLIWSHQQSMA
jgi:hypothetical protein